MTPTTSKPTMPSQNTPKPKLNESLMNSSYLPFGNENSSEEITDGRERRDASQAGSNVAQDGQMSKSAGDMPASASSAIRT